MNLEQIKESWDKDCNINILELDSEIVKTSVLHQKYMKLFVERSQTVKKLEIDLNVLKKKLREYYLGQADDKVYSLKPFPLKLLKNEIHDYVESDEEYVQAVSKLEMNRIILQYLESILKQLNNRNFQIKNYIDWQKFTNGEY